VTANHRLICTLCGEKADWTDWRCRACGGALRIAWTGPAPAVRIAEHGRGLWRYRPLLPSIGWKEGVTLGEGGTPLVWIERWAAAHQLGRVGLKLESLNPTGSFKDRGAAVLASHARALGIARLIEDSSGNAGASIAAYAARAGLTAVIFVPASAPAAKRAQIARLGAEVVPIAGPRAAAAEAAATAAGRGAVYYAAHNWNPYFAAGMATFAYELIEELGETGVDHLVIPTGGGSLFVGAYDGFVRWQDATGTTVRLPRFQAVQSVGCAPLVAAFQRGLDDVPPITRHPTVAGGIEIERPPRGRLILSVLRTTGGTAVAVEDAEIIAERERLAELEGIDLEPTAAAALAGLARLARDGVVQREETVIVAATGAGWKDPGPLGSSPSRPE